MRPLALALALLPLVAAVTDADAKGGRGGRGIWGSSRTAKPASAPATAAGPRATIAPALVVLPIPTLRGGSGAPVETVTATTTRPAPADAATARPAPAPVRVPTRTARAPCPSDRLIGAGDGFCAVN